MVTQVGFYMVVSENGGHPYEYDSFKRTHDDKPMSENRWTPNMCDSDYKTVWTEIM